MGQSGESLGRVRYKLVKWCLVAAIVAASAFALLQRSWPLGAAALVGVFCLGAWLWRSRDLLSEKYREAETSAAVVSPRDKLIWGDKKPRVRDMAIPFFVFSFVGLWFAYEAATAPYKPSTGLSGGMLNLIHAHAGAPGVVLFWLAAWAGLMTFSAEMVVGSRAARK